MQARSRCRRVRTGCLTCRARKVKCDEAAGTCESCRRLDLVCRRGSQSVTLSSSPSPYCRSEESQSVSNKTNAGTTRFRNTKSCDNCRNAKIKCSGERPSCSHCRTRLRFCNYQSTNDGTPTMLNLEDLPPILVQYLVALYFQYGSTIDLVAFLHVPSFKRSLSENKVPVKLLSVVCALGTIFHVPQSRQLRIDEIGNSRPIAPSVEETGLDDQGIMQLGELLCQRTKSLVLTEFDKPSLLNLQVLVLLVLYESLRGSPPSVWILSAVVARMARGLQLLEGMELEKMSQNLNPIEVECRIRIMWSIYCADQLRSEGLPQISLISQSDINIRLPCLERNFLFGIACEGASLERLPNETSLDRKNMGLTAYMIRLLSLRRQVLEYIKSVNTNPVKPWSESSVIPKIQESLLQWKADLPLELELTQNNIWSRHLAGQSAEFFRLHILYHQNFIGLTRICYAEDQFSMLEDLMIEAPDEFLQSMSRTCFEHAIQNIEVALKFCRLLPKDLFCVPFVNTVCIRETILIIGFEIKANNLLVEQRVEISRKILTLIEYLKQQCKLCNIPRYSKMVSNIEDLYLQSIIGHNIASDESTHGTHFKRNNPADLKSKMRPYAFYNEVVGARAEPIAFTFSSSEQQDSSEQQECSLTKDYATPLLSENMASFGSSIQQFDDGSLFFSDTINFDDLFGLGVEPVKPDEDTHFPSDWMNPALQT